MYQIIVGELDRGRKRGGRPLAVEKCRISALSSADFCLGSRVELARGRFAWKGSGREIRRLFEAERLNSAGVAHLSGDRDYAVLFLGSRAECA